MDMGRPITQRVVIKIGGALIDEDTALDALFEQINCLRTQGVEVILVHGGGPQASMLSHRLGIEPVKVGGRRITDADTLEVVQMVYGGLLQTRLVAAARRKGLAAVGISGVDGRLIEATRRPPLTVEGQAVDFGWVGEIKQVRPQIIETLLHTGFLPVVSPLAGNDAGEVFNINADTLAANLALALQADALVFVLQTGGVLTDLQDKESIVPALDQGEAQVGIQEGWIHTGMQPKLTAGFKAVKEGVPAVWIAAVQELAAVVTHKKGKGTRLTC